MPESPKVSLPWEAHIAEGRHWEKEQRDRLAITSYEKALACCPQETIETQEIRLRLYFSLAQLWCQQGKYGVGIKCYDTALAESSVFHQGKPHEQQGICHYKCAQLFETLWRLDPALDHYEKALSQLMSVWAPDHPIIQKVMAERDVARRKYEKNKADKAVDSLPSVSSPSSHAL